MSPLTIGNELGHGMVEVAGIIIQRTVISTTQMSVCKEVWDKIKGTVSLDHGAKVLATCRGRRWSDCEGVEGRFGFHNFRHSLASAMVKMKVAPKTVQGMLRHEDFNTTMDLYTQSDMEAMREAQGMFLEQMLGDKIHLLTEPVH